MTDDGALIGRDRELSRLRQMIDALALGGRPGPPALIVLGEVGIGKTVLLAEAERRARSSGLRVLSAVGRESERDLAFAGLHQLLQPVLGCLADLPERQAKALLGAFGRASEPVSPDALITGIAVLTLLSRLAEEGPTLVLADDAQWLDRASADALAFAARRLESEPLALLLGARGAVPPPSFASDFPELAVPPLDRPDSDRLLDAQPRPPLTMADTLRGQPDRCAWHRAAAALEPDEQVAALLEETAAQARQRGGAAAAARALERAAELSPSLTDQARRLIAAGELARPTGETDWVQELAARVLTLTADPVLRFTARQLSGWALMWSDRHAEAFPVLISVAEEAADQAPTIAWGSVALSATLAYHSGTAADRQRVRAVFARLREPEPGARWHADRTESIRLWVRVATEPFGDRAELSALLGRLAEGPVSDIAGVGAAAWLLDQSELAIRLLRGHLSEVSGPGVRGRS